MGPNRELTYAAVAMTTPAITAIATDAKVTSFASFSLLTAVEALADAEKRMVRVKQAYMSSHSDPQKEIARLRKIMKHMSSMFTSIGTAILFAGTACEALANDAVATKFSSIMFEHLDRAPIRDKVALICKLAYNVELPKGQGILQALGDVIRGRDALAHPRPRVTDASGKTIAKAFETTIKINLEQARHSVSRMIEVWTYFLELDPNLPSFEDLDARLGERRANKLFPAFRKPPVL